MRLVEEGDDFVAGFEAADALCAGGDDSASAVRKWYAGKGHSEWVFALGDYQIPIVEGDAFDCFEVLLVSVNG